MTPTEIEQMCMDMAAGTPGPWFVSGGRAKIERNSCHCIMRYDADKKQDEHICAVWYDPKTNLGWIDARRIARLPDLEIDYLALIEENERLRTALAEIAGQKLVAEMERPHDADFEVGYDTCVSTARAALGETK